VSRPPPRYIVVEGPIGVGKTTLARRLAASLGGRLLAEAPEENPFLPRFYANPRAHALSTQLSFLLQRARQVEGLRQGDLFLSCCVADFMLDKDRLFAQLNLEADELGLYEEVYARLALNAPEPELVVLLQAPVDVLLSRIRRRARAYESEVQSAYLARLSDAYAEFFQAYERSPLLVVDTTQLDLRDDETHYTRVLREVLSARAGRHQLGPVLL
jgi:deoxyadenosine/deoxycytidine kinase